MKPVGVLVMAHGTPHVARRAPRLLHRDPTRQPASRRAARRPRTPLPGHRRDLAAQRAHRRAGRRDPSRPRPAGTGALRRGRRAPSSPPRGSPTPWASLGRAGVGRVIGLVLAPHFSTASVGDYARRARDAAAALGPAEGGPLDVEMIDHWHLAPGFVPLAGRRGCATPSTALARRGAPGRRRSSSRPTASRRDSSTPATRTPRRCSSRPRPIAEAAGLARWSVAWQSAGRTADAWLGPDVRDVIAALPGSGASAVVVCPVGFVSDHLEVLYDIDIEARAVADDAGHPLRPHRVAQRRPRVLRRPRRRRARRGRGRARLTMARRRRPTATPRSTAPAHRRRRRRRHRRAERGVGAHRGCAGEPTSWCSSPTTASGGSCAPGRSVDAPSTSGPTPSWPDAPRPWPCAGSSASTTSSCRRAAAPPTCGPAAGSAACPPAWRWACRPASAPWPARASSRRSGVGRRRGRPPGLALAGAAPGRTTRSGSTGGRHHPAASRARGHGATRRSPHRRHPRRGHHPHEHGRGVPGPPRGRRTARQPHARPAARRRRRRPRPPAAPTGRGAEPPVFHTVRGGLARLVDALAAALAARVSRSACGRRSTASSAAPATHRAAARLGPAHAAEHRGGRRRGHRHPGPAGGRAARVRSTVRLGRDAGRDRLRGRHARHAADARGRRRPRASTAPASSCPRARGA